MATKIEMISNALILIGDKPLNDLDEPGYKATVANNLYDNIVLKELGAHRWGFARRKAQVSEVVTTLPDDEWSHVYQLPSDLITLIKVRPNPFDYKVFGSQIYTRVSADPVTVDYIANVTETEWPPHFVKMIEYALAKDYALPIRDSAASKQQMQAEYIEAAKNARYIDSQQHTQTSIQHRPFETIRF